jgi:hypothetical protein
LSELAGQGGQYIQDVQMMVWGVIARRTIIRTAGNRRGHGFAVLFF